MISHVRAFSWSAVLLGSCLAHPQNAGPTPSQTQPQAESAASPTTGASPIPADSTQLEVITTPQPDYPLEAAAKGLQGKVWIQLHISENGDVESTEIVSGDPILAKAAEIAMKQWKFKPFIKAGKPVKVSRKVPYEFILKGKVGDPCATVEAVSAMNLAHHQLRISQAVAEHSIVRRVEPEYPVLARIKHLQGTVILDVVIGEDGRVSQLKALCGPPELVPASMDAVRQWRYRPYVYDGKPASVETTVKIQFHIG